MATVKVKLRILNARDTRGKICYQITHRRIVRRITTEITVECDARHGTPELRDVHIEDPRIDEDLALLADIISYFERMRTPYTADDMVAQFRRLRNKVSVLALMRERIDHLRCCNRLSTARNYERTLNSFARFLGRDIPVADIDEQLIDRYNIYLLRREVVRNTVSFYMRILRAVYNRAVNMKIVEQTYPFRNVYTGIDRTRKRAVDRHTIARLNRLDLAESSSLSLARDMFMFSFFTRGMAFVDMIHLSRDNIRDGVISYVRRKTGCHLVVRIEPSIGAIIERYLTAERQYIFPVLGGAGGEREFVRYQSALTYYNRRLKKLSYMLGLDTPLSSYSSRHSWATAARSLNVPLSVISEGMGHSTERTTRIYLAMLESSAIDKANLGIIDAVNLSSPL